MNRNSNQIILASGYLRQKKYNKQNHTHITANKSNKQYKQSNRGLENEDQSLKLRNKASKATMDEPLIARGRILKIKIMDESTI